MAASTALGSVVDVESFINEYFGAWQGTDEDRYVLLRGRRVASTSGHPHGGIFGQGVVVVEWSFEAEHKGPFAGRPATDAHVQVPGCSVYQYDSAKRQITAGRIYFDVGTLLKQIGAAVVFLLTGLARQEASHESLRMPETGQAWFRQESAAAAAR